MWLEILTCLSVTDKTSRQSGHRRLEQPYQTTWTNISGTFYPTVAECTFFSSAYWTFTKINNILGHDTNVSKFKRIKVMQTIVWNNKRIKPEISNKKTSGKFPSIWKVNDTLWNNTVGQEEVWRKNLNI